MPRLQSKRERRELAKEFLKVLIAKSPYLSGLDAAVDEANDLEALRRANVRGAFAYADEFLRQLK